MSEAGVEESSTDAPMLSQVSEATWDREAVGVLIQESMHPLFRRLHATLVNRYIEEMASWVFETSAAFKAPAGLRSVYLTLILGVIQSCNQSKQRVREWRAGLDLLRHRLVDAAATNEAGALILQFLETLGTSKAGLDADRAALDRYLDIDAVEERVVRMEVAETALQEVAISAAGALLADEIRNIARHQEDVDDPFRYLIDQSGISAFLKGYVTLNMPWRLACAALEAMGRMARALPPTWRNEQLDPDVYQTAFRIGLDPVANLWVQRRALRVLYDFNSEEAVSVWRRRLLEGANMGGDDLFIRRAIVGWVGDLGAQVEGTPLLEAVLGRPDGSPYVRMGAARALRTQPFNDSAPLLERVLGMARGHPADSCNQVRAEALLAVVGKSGPGGPDNEQNRWVLRTCERSLASPPEALQTGLLLDELPGLLDRLAGRSEGMGSAVHHVLQALDQLMAQPSLPMDLLRQAQECREAIIVTRLAEFSNVEKILLRISETVVEGERFSLSVEALGVSEKVLGRILCYFARQGFGWFAEIRGSNVCIQKGDRFRRKAWRIMHEIWNPASDKRSGFYHSVGRVPFGHIRAHPLRLGEGSVTQVPGERRYLESEGQWRRYLPLVDDLFSLCDGFGAPVRVELFSAQGVTTLTGPPGLLKKLQLLAKLTVNYAKVSRLRDQPFSGENQEPLRRFLKKLKRMGVIVSFKPNGYVFEGEFHPLRDSVLERLMPVRTLSAAGLQETQEEGLSHG